LSVNMEYVRGIALEHLSVVCEDVAHIIIPELADRLPNTAGSRKWLFVLALSRLLTNLEYAERVTESFEAFQDSAAGRRTRAHVKATVPLLTSELQSKDASMRESAALALAVIGPEAGPALVELSKMLKSKDKQEILDALAIVHLFRSEAMDTIPH